MPELAQIQIILPTFLIILVGYAISKVKRLRFDVQTLLDLIVYIAAPALIITSIARSDINLIDFATLAGAALTIILIMALAAFLIFKITQSDKKGLYLPMVFGNTSFLGYPIALAAFGIDGLALAVVYDMMHSLLIYSLGIYIVQQKNEIREIFKVPLLYAVVIGMVLNLLKIPIPDMLFAPVELIGMTAIPLALLVLGYKLAEMKINLSVAKIAVLASIFRILGGLLLAISIISLFSIEGLVRDIIVLQAAMPSAIMALVLATKYNRDASLVAAVVFITTLLSIISIPLILSIPSA